MGIGKELTGLMNSIKYSFCDIKLLQTALTHSSYTNEMRVKGFRAESNEALEFLGDSVLQIVISEYLFDKYSKQGEGALTKLRQNLVCESTLARLAKGLDLGAYMNIGTGEENIGLRSSDKILADAFEALIAAIYIDDRTNSSGNTYRAIIICLFNNELEQAISTGYSDYKTMLQEFVEKNGDSILNYVISEDGPEHSKTFYATAFINNNEVGKGKGKTKRAAEMQAAKVALKLFGIL